MRKLSVVLVSLIFLTSCASGDEVIPHGQDRMPGPALTPQESLERMQVPEGFTVELVASEPDIVNPVAMAFDEKGRIWITESIEYPRHAAGPGRDRIKVLEDTNGDGYADHVTVFADTLNIPSGIAIGHGGVWVANAPDILFMQDTNGDGRADHVEVVATGFGRDDTHELPNSLTWGPDGYLYGLNGVFNPSTVTYGSTTYEFTAAIFRIHPITHEFEIFAEGTSNPWGIAFDPEGNLFISACVIDHLWHITETGYYRRQAGAYPEHTWFLESIVDHQHYKAAYCGLVYHESDTYPDEYSNRLFMGNIHGNSLNVDVLSREGATYHATGAPDFFEANDAWSMPVSQKTGPDGSLYVLDWYDRYHCYQDALRDPEGVNRSKGRLYRIRYQDAARVQNMDLHAESDDELIGRLHSDNIFLRDTARRLLAERDEPETRAKLEALVMDTDLERNARMNALWAMVSTGTLNPTFHRQLLEYDDPGFRAWAVRAAGNMGMVDESIRSGIVDLVNDSSPDVRLQVVIAARKLDGIDPIESIMEALELSLDDRLIPVIAWQNMYPIMDRESDRFLERMAALDLAQAPILGEFTSRSVERLLAAEEVDAGTVSDLIDILWTQELLEDVGRTFRLLAGRYRTGDMTRERQEALRHAIEPSVSASLRGDGPEIVRRDAALLAASWGDPDAVAFLRASMDAGEVDSEDRVDVLAALVTAGDERVLGDVVRLIGDEELSDSNRQELIGLLARMDAPQVADRLLEIYPDLNTDLRLLTVEVLTQRTAWTHALLDAVEDGRVSSDDLSTQQVQQLVATADEDLRDRLNATIGVVRTEANPDRQLVIARVEELMNTRRGDPANGERVFERVCSACHVIHGQGTDLGPDLTNNGRGSLEVLLSNVLDPNLMIGAGYQMATVITLDGRRITGMLAEDSPDRVVVRMMGGASETIARSNVSEVQVSDRSFMPEGLEQAMTDEEIVDLFTFLSYDRHPDNEMAIPIRGAEDIIAGR